jgi:hypothetical protein
VRICILNRSISNLSSGFLGDLRVFPAAQHRRPWIPIQSHPVHTRSIHRRIRPAKTVRPAVARPSSRHPDTPLPKPSRATTPLIRKERPPPTTSEDTMAVQPCPRLPPRLTKSCARSAKRENTRPATHADSGRSSATTRFPARPASVSPCLSCCMLPAPGVHLAMGLLAIGRELLWRTLELGECMLTMPFRAQSSRAMRLPPSR